MSELLCNGSCSDSPKHQNAATNEHVCNCTGKALSHEVSPIIDADQERKTTLLHSREELVRNIREIGDDYIQRRDAVLAPMYEALQKTDDLLEDLNRPSCFGTYTCTDRDLESCPVERSGACYRKVKGCC